MIRDCPGAADYINRSLCKQDPANNRIVLPNNGWIPRWTTGNKIKERLDDYYRQNPVPAAAAPIAIPLAPTTGIKDIPPHMSQNLLEVVENLHATVSADPDNTDDDEAIIQALQQAQQALEQKKKKQVRFDGVEMPPMRKGKAPDRILKHPDQAGAAKENQSSAAGPSAPVSRITVSTPIIVRGHPSVSLLLLSSPTFYLCIGIPPSHLRTLSKDRTYSRRPPGPIVVDFPRPYSARTSTASDGLRTHGDKSA
jgi:hypothetical protein